MEQLVQLHDFLQSSSTPEIINRKLGLMISKGKIMKILQESRVLRKEQYKPFFFLYFFTKYHMINSLYMILKRTMPMCHEDTQNRKQLNIHQSAALND